MKILSFLHDFIFISQDRPYKPYLKSLDTCAYIGASICILIISVYYIISAILNIQLTDYMPPCLFHAYTGYYCPGCGGTRSILFLLKGELINSVIYHPIIVFTSVPGIWLFISHSIFRYQCRQANYSIKSKNLSSALSAKHKKRTTYHKVVRPLTVQPAYIYTGIAILITQCLIKNLLKLILDYSII